jgi:hypothetical protein
LAALNNATPIDAAATELRITQMHFITSPPQLILPLKIELLAPVTEKRAAINQINIDKSTSV